MMIFHNKPSFGAEHVMLDFKLRQIRLVIQISLSIFCKWLMFISYVLQVDENGKIHRLRRECPAEQCGAGVFMAAMEDRHYCGKCGYTLVFSRPEGGPSEK